MPFKIFLRFDLKPDSMAMACYLRITMVQNHDLNDIFLSEMEAAVCIAKMLEHAGKNINTYLTSQNAHDIHFLMFCLFK